MKRYYFKGKEMKYIILIAMLLAMSGCSSIIENKAYKDFQKSPCACFDKEKSRGNDHV